MNVELQTVNFLYDFKQIDFSLYYLIEKYNSREISRDYYVEHMAEALKHIYIVLEKNELAKYMPSKNSFSKDLQINKIRQFLCNLDLTEIKKLGLDFCELNVIENENFKTIYRFFKTING